MKLRLQHSPLSLALLVVLLCGFTGCGVHSLRPVSAALADQSLDPNAAEDQHDVRLLRVEKVSEYKIELGDEYSKYNSGAAPGRGSAKGGEVSGKGHSWARAAALYLPNRFLDALDIFRFDLGLGISWGYALRFTRYAQVGYREFAPASLRFGLRGRKVPVFLEKDSEFGISPGYVSSRDRKVTAGEFGFGADLLLVGAYIGVCVDEAWDFLAGIVGFDVKGDDFR